MIEIPESIVLSKQLNETIKGKLIRYAKANQSPHKFAWYHESPEGYTSLLEDKTIEAIVPRAGIVEIQAEDVTLTLSDGCCLHYYEDYTKVPKKNQLYLEFTDDTALAVSVQMYGCIFAFRDGTFHNEYYEGACRKPVPLSKEFTEDYFLSLYDEKLSKKSLKAFLATEQRIPGLGNGVLQDILYQAKLHPKRKMETVSLTELKMLYQTILRVLSEMIEQGGRDTEKDLYGNYGQYMTYLSKKTYGTPCPLCGYEIHKEAYMGGTIYYCEHCQH